MTKEKMTEEATKDRGEHIFDDAFRTMEEHVPELMIPLINEVFGKNYPPDVKITRMGDRHHRLGLSRETDSALGIEDKIYHLECESNPKNGRIIGIRMFEYDISVGLDGKFEENGVTVVPFPVSCVLYLRHNRNTKKEERVLLRMADGRGIMYRVPIIRVQEYSKEEIFEKRLYMLLPFYIMRFEDQLPELEKDEEKRELLVEEYRDIMSRLYKELYVVDVEYYSEIYGMMKHVMDYILRRNGNVKKGVDQVMGGKVLESFREKTLREGREEGENLAYVKLVRNGLLDISVAAEQAGMDIKEFEKMVKEYVIPA